MPNIISIGNLNTDAGSGYSATFEYSYTRPQLDYTAVPREGRPPLVTNITVVPAPMPPIDIMIESDDAATTRAKRQALLRALDTRTGPVTITRAAEDGLPARYMNVIVSKVDQKPGSGGREFVATVTVVDDIYWRDVNVKTLEQAITASGQTYQVTNGGDVDVRPVITLVPREGKSGSTWKYARKVLARFPYAPSVGAPWNQWPVEITGVSGLNTAALVSAGKMTTRYNLAVMVDGRFVPYWYGGDDGRAKGFNSAETRIWVNLSEHTHPSIRVIEDYDADATALALRTLEDKPVWGAPPPYYGRAYFPDTGEIITWAGVEGNTVQAVRGVDGTTPAPLTSGMTGEMIHDITILYGPTADIRKDYGNEYTIPMLMERDRSPVVNEASVNSSWRFYNFAHKRPFSSGLEWQFTGNIGNWNSCAYVHETDLENDDGWGYEEPWTGMGFQANTNNDGGYFSLPLPRPIWRVYIEGRRMEFIRRVTTTRVPELVGVSKGTQQTSFQIWSADTGGNFNKAQNQLYAMTFEWPTRSDVLELQWGLLGESFLQADISFMRIDFTPAYVPIVTMGAEQDDYDMNLTLANQTTGENITVNLPDMQVDKPLVIDCEYQTVTYDEGNANRYSAVRRDVPRGHFLSLAPGPNTIQVVEAGLVEVNVTMQYREGYYV